MERCNSVNAEYSDYSKRGPLYRLFRKCSAVVEPLSVGSMCRFSRKSKLMIDTAHDLYSDIEPQTAELFIQRFVCLLCCHFVFLSTLPSTSHIDSIHRYTRNGPAR